jgi:hypothetical protein
MTASADTTRQLRFDLLMGARAMLVEILQVAHPDERHATSVALSLVGQLIGEAVP